MATVKQTSRVVLNRSRVEQVRLALADGLFAIAQEVVIVSDPPDAPPYGKGLVEGGGALAFVDKRKVNGTTIGGRQIKKPRHLQLPQKGIVAIGGYGFPGRFVHNGTLDTHPNPFLQRALLEVVPDAKRIIRSRVIRWLKSVR